MTNQQKNQKNTRSRRNEANSLTPVQTSAQERISKTSTDRFTDALLGGHEGSAGGGTKNSPAKMFAEKMPTPGDISQDDFLSTLLSNDDTRQAVAHTPTDQISLLTHNREQELLLASSTTAPLSMRLHAGATSKKISVALLLLTVAFFSYVTGYLGYGAGSSRGTRVSTDTAAGREDPFAQIVLEARAAYVYDMTSGTPLYALREHDTLPLASLTKLMTAVVAGELLPLGTVVTVGTEDIKEEGDSGLFSGERWKLSDIIGFTLMTSSNDGASALAAVAGSLGQNVYGEPVDESKRKFIDAMNKKGEELGLRGTHFFNESGLDINEEISGGYGTARDVALLMAHIVKIGYKNLESTTLARTTVISLDNIRHNATNTNEEVNAIPGILASKTGYTDLAGGNLAIAFDAGLSHPIVVVVLGSTREGRFQDAEALAWAALEKLGKLP